MAINEEAMVSICGFLLTNILGFANRGF